MAHSRIRMLPAIQVQMTTDTIQQSLSPPLPVTRLPDCYLTDLAIAVSNRTSNGSSAIRGRKVHSRSPRLYERKSGNVLLHFVNGAALEYDHRTRRIDAPVNL